MSFHLNPRFGNISPMIHIKPRASNYRPFTEVSEETGRVRMGCTRYWQDEDGNEVSETTYVEPPGWLRWMLGDRPEAKAKNRSFLSPELLDEHQPSPPSDDPIDCIINLTEDLIIRNESGRLCVITKEYDDGFTSTWTYSVDEDGVITRRRPYGYAPAQP